MVQQPPGGPMTPPPPPPGMQPPPPPGMTGGPSSRPSFATGDEGFPLSDVLVAGGALLCFIFTLLNWYRVKIWGITAGSGRGGYQNWPMVIYLFLLIFAGLMVVNRFANLMSLQLPLGIIYLAWSAAGTFFTLLAFLIRPGDWDYVKMNWAIWIIMLILSVIPIVGGVLKLQEE